MFFKKQSKFNNGFSLVEILVGVSIICVSLLLIVNLETGISKIGYGSMARVQAGMLAEEGITAVRNIRNSSWQNINTLNNNVPYRLYWDQAGKTWQATTSATLIDGQFDRTVTFYAVNRDSTSFDIVQSGGAVDYGTRGFIVNVSWLDNNGTSTRSLTSYIYNIFNK